MPLRSTDPYLANGFGKSRNPAFIPATGWPVATGYGGWEG